MRNFITIAIVLAISILSVEAQTITVNKDGTATIEVTTSFEKAVKVIVSSEIKARTNSQVTVITNNTQLYKVNYNKGVYTCTFVINDSDKVLETSTRVSDIRNSIIDHILAE